MGYALNDIGSDGERHMTKESFHRDNTLSSLFEEIVLKFGDKIAVQGIDYSITYSDLNIKANQLANNLLERGITSNKIVVLYFERCIELMICMLAVIKAGGLYLPIYVKEAQDRLKLIIEDSNPEIIITNTKGVKSLVSNLSVSTQSKTLDIEQFFSTDLAKNAANPSQVNTAADPACVIYTSGSTGTPKGCVLPQMGITRLVKNTNYICIEPTDVMANMSNPAFDASTFEIWGALLNGAKLCVVPDVVLLSPPDFADFLRHNRISVACLTTALLNFTTKIQPDAFDNLRCLLFAGEKANAVIVKALLIRKLEQNLDNLNIIHLYGPAENTTAATFFEIKDEQSIGDNVPIGRSISNTKTYVLDKDLNLSKPEEVGEIYLAGDGLSLGYLNDPEQTAQKFIACPWDSKQKMYKTGDLAYWLPTVGAVFVGRADSQVKIHGFRVEISEIEACITKHPMVQHVTVVVEQNESLDKGLCAYINFDQKFNKFNSFYEYLTRSLPHYMLPQKIIKIDYIPLNNNGKIDKKLLAKLPGENIIELCYVDKSSNDLAKTISSIWQGLLGVEKIDTQQNIFALGAHSLMLMEVCLRLNEQLNITKKINVVDLLTYPTIQLLEAYISGDDTQSNILENANSRGNLRKQSWIRGKLSNVG
jgi:bacitracin synthase 1